MSTWRFTGKNIDCGLKHGIILKWIYYYARFDENISTFPVKGKPLLHKLIEAESFCPKASILKKREEIMLKKVLVLIPLLAFMVSCGKSVTPEMKAFINAFEDSAKLTAFVQKHAEPEVMPKEIKLCDLEKPVVTDTKEKDGRVYYTLEAKVKKCERSETAVGTTRIFSIGWKDGRIVDFKWKGPKSGKVEY